MKYFSYNTIISYFFETSIAIKKLRQSKLGSNSFPILHWLLLDYNTSKYSRSLLSISGEYKGNLTLSTNQ